MEKEENSGPQTVTDLDALQLNAEAAAKEFGRRWMSAPKFTLNCEVMDQAQLRDAMGLRATFEYGDPWPAVEELLVSMGFRWHLLGSQRVMFLMERKDYTPDTGWEEAEEVSS